MRPLQHPQVPQVGLAWAWSGYKGTKACHHCNHMPVPCADISQIPEMPRLFLTSDLDRYQWEGGLRHLSTLSPWAHGAPCLSALIPLSSLSFLVTPHGCSVTLACGVRLQFPAGATTTPITIHYRLWLPEPHLVSLGPHDFLLSGVLELQPHGVAFQQVCQGWVGGRYRLAFSHTPPLPDRM